MKKRLGRFGVWMVVVMAWIILPANGFTAPMAYISNVAGGTVSVIDTATNTVVQTIPVDVGPNGVAVNAAGTTAYVANYNSDTVSVTDTKTNAVTATIPVGDRPVGVAIHPSGTRAQVLLTIPWGRVS